MRAFRVYRPIQFKTAWGEKALIHESAIIISRSAIAYAYIYVTHNRDHEISSARCFPRADERPPIRGQTQCALRAVFIYSTRRARIFNEPSARCSLPLSLSRRRVLHILSALQGQSHRVEFNIVCDLLRRGTASRREKPVAPQDYLRPRRFLGTSNAIVGPLA